MILAMLYAIKEIAIKPEKISRLWTGFELVTSKFFPA